MAATVPVPLDPESKTGDDIEAAKNLKRLAARQSRSAPFKSAPGNGKAQGTSVAGGARIRGGRA